MGNSAVTGEQAGVMDMRRLGGDLEAEVMRQIWQAGRPYSVRDVMKSLSSERTLAYTTVMTVLDRLTKKGLLCRQAEDRSYVYVPAMSRDDYTAAELREVLGRAGDRDAALFRFLGQMQPEELSALRHILNQVDGEDQRS